VHVAHLDALGIVGESVSRLIRFHVAVADTLIEKEDLVSLDNGCVCCSLRKDIVKALAEIERRSRQRNKRLDQVILETTGLADPAPVAFTFLTNPWVASRFKLDSIV